MAQPLTQTELAQSELDYTLTSGIDASASRLEKALRRLETVAAGLGTRYASLKADQEKLNRLLKESQGQVTEMRQAVTHVNSRLDHTIATLEAMDG